MSQQSVHARTWNLPDTEESQHVIDAVGIKVLCHLGEPTLPPLVAVLCHCLPVVGWETPVLACGTEGIGWCSGLPVKMEQVRSSPGFHTCAADADGDVALEPYAHLVGMGRSFPQLLVEQVLHKGVIAGFAVPVLHQCTYFSSLIGRVLWPLGVVAGAILVAQQAESAVGQKPVLIVGVECVVFLFCLYALAFLGIECMQVVMFERVDRLVIHLCHCVEFGGTCFHLAHECLLGQSWQLSQVGIHGMERVDADGAVGVTVAPGVALGGVVDGQQLYRMHPGFGSQVGSHCQVAHITASLASL